MECLGRTFCEKMVMPSPSVVAIVIVSSAATCELGCVVVDLRCEKI